MAELCVSTSQNRVVDLLFSVTDSPAAQDRSQADGSAASADSPATLAAQSGKPASETFPAAPSSGGPGLLEASASWPTASTKSRPPVVHVRAGCVKMKR